jgi:TDG/mug DNA glycosylase family protein
LVRPWEERWLLVHGLGVTNLVARATATAAELARDELQAGCAKLERKVHRYRPGSVAVLGIGAYRMAFSRPRATVGRQPEALAGAMLWVLPNPSGLNANHQLADLAQAFRALREAVEGHRRAGA